MMHSFEVKKNVLNLLNEGYSIVEIEKKTGVTQKTISGWRNKWRDIDKPKKEVIDKIWIELKTLVKKPFENASKIKTLSASLTSLRSELIINGKYYDL